MQFAAQNKSGNAKEMSNMILGAANAAKKEGISFSPNETDMIVEILKQNMNPVSYKHLRDHETLSDGVIGLWR